MDMPGCWAPETDIIAVFPCCLPKSHSSCCLGSCQKWTPKVTSTEPNFGKNPENSMKGAVAYWAIPGVYNANVWLWACSWVFKQRQCAFIFLDLRSEAACDHGLYLKEAEILYIPLRERPIEILGTLEKTCIGSCWTVALLECPADGGACPPATWHPLTMLSIAVKWQARPAAAWHADATMQPARRSLEVTWFCHRILVPH